MNPRHEFAHATRPGPDRADQPARVLIVDDARVNRTALEIMLIPEGFHLQIASSGEEALALVAEHPPDLILLDVMMAGIDGYQVATRLKSAEATKNIPIIMVTALDDRDARMLGLKAGAEDFLTKPVDRAELCVRVRNLLRLKAYGDYYGRYSQRLEGEVAARTSDLVERTRTLERQTAILTEHAARLSLATAVAKVGVWELDLPGNTLTWDATMFEIYGMRSVIPMPYAQWSQAIHPDDLPTVEAGLRSAIATQGQGAAEYRIVRRADGAVRHVSAVERAVVDEHGTVVRLIGVDMDVTERKAAEQALEQSSRDQIRFKDDFLSHVSHELRTPLTAIKQFTTILLNGLAGDLNPEQREYQEIVLKNIRQLQSMIDDLLEVTRLETGKLTVEDESVSVVGAVTDAFDTLKGSALAKEIVLSHDLPSDLPNACADPMRLRQIFIILLDNAIQFTPAGGHVNLRVQRQTHDPGLLLFEVSDTGCGISPEVSARLFDRLYQVANPSQASRKGLGLGLYICKELVTRQRGEIWATRRAPRGTVMSFTLPVFSLEGALAPLLVNGRWPAKSFALVTACSPDAWRSKESRDQWSRQARILIERCLLPDLDVLLPRMGSDAEVECFHVASFADDTGAAALATRIREQFERHLNQTCRAFSVSHRMLGPNAPGPGASDESVAADLAACLEASITSQFQPEAVHHEQP